MAEARVVAVRIVPQLLRVLPGELVVEAAAGAADDDAIARMYAPDGETVVRWAREGDAERSVAIFSGGSAHGLDAPGMTASLLAPLAAAAIPVFAVGTIGADLVLVPAGRIEEALDALVEVGHVLERG